MELVHRGYRRLGQRLELGRRPNPPRPARSLVVVPGGGVSRLTHDAIAAALSMGDRAIAVHVSHPGDDGGTAGFLTAWDDWSPGIPLVRLHDERHRLAEHLEAPHGVEITRPAAHHRGRLPPTLPDR